MQRSRDTPMALSTFPTHALDTRHSPHCHNNRLHHTRCRSVAISLLRSLSRIACARTPAHPPNVLSASLV